MKKLIRNKHDLREFIEAIENIDLSKPYIASFTAQKKQRSLKQNALLWMWLRCIKDETGNDVETLHDYFCSRYLPWNEECMFGNDFVKTTGTSQLNTKEFTDFLENIQIEMCDKQNIYLPNPGDQGWDEFYTKYGVDTNE